MALFKSKIKKTKDNNSKKSTEKVIDHILKLDDNNFNEFINKYSLSVVDFWAPWCAPCRELTPRFRRLSKIYKEKVAFGKLDIQKYPDIAKKYKILTIPHIIFFSFGKQISSLSGLRSIGDMKNEIDACYKKLYR
jgi:thioredoxin 1